MAVALNLTTNIKRIIWSVVSDSNGNFSEQTISSWGEMFRVNGLIHSVLVIPSDINPPNNNFDISITDQFGVDVLRGQGMDLPNNEPTVFFNINTPMLSPLTLNASNCGSGKNFSVVLYYN